jgi:hypothetical protein
LTVEGDVGVAARFGVEDLREEPLPDLIDLVTPYVVEALERSILLPGVVDAPVMWVYSRSRTRIRSIRRSAGARLLTIASPPGEERAITGPRAPALGPDRVAVRNTLAELPRGTLPRDQKGLDTLVQEL